MSIPSVSVNKRKSHEHIRRELWNPRLEENEESMRKLKGEQEIDRANQKTEGFGGGKADFIMAPNQAILLLFL